MASGVGRLQREERRIQAGELSHLRSLTVTALVAERIEVPLAGRWPELWPFSGRQCQPVGDQPQRRWIDAETEMAAAHLDVVVDFGLRLDADLPRPDAVAAGGDPPPSDRGRARGLPAR